MSSAFDKYYNKYDAWYDKHEFAFLSEIAAIKKVLPQGKKGLEIGTGTGRFAAGLGITIGIEPSNNMLEIARSRGVDARWGFGERLPFLNGIFDYVAIIISLCFIKNQQEVLLEAARVLKKNGRIIIGIVDKKGFLGKFYLFRGLITTGHLYLAIAGILGSLISVYYYVRPLIMAYYYHDQAEVGGEEFSYSTLGIILFCLIATILLGLFPSVVMDVLVVSG